MKRVRTLSFFLGCLLCAAYTFAQFDKAEVLGTMRDQSGAIVPNAAVTLLNQDIGDVLIAANFR